MGSYIAVPAEVAGEVEYIIKYPTCYSLKMKNADKAVRCDGIIDVYLTLGRGH